MKKIGLLSLLIGLLFSCNPNIDFKKIVPQHVDKFATGFIDDLKQGNIDECLLKVIPEMNNQAGRDYLTNSFKSIQSLHIDSIRIINARQQTLMGENGFTNHTIDYEYFIKDKYLYFTFGIREQNNKLSITAFDGRFFETSLTEIHSFTLDKKGLVHYLFIFFAILIPVFILVTLVFTIRAKLSRKWLWIIGILLGFVKFSLNWTTGQVGFQIISFQLLGAGFSKAGLVAPWTLSFTLPIVAVIFWIKRYNDKKTIDTSTTPTDQIDKKENG
ncbi:MAG: hypothetical protein ACK5TU_08910 [Cyclobacteriaceae bacterium]|jgi:hypothetical protein